MAHSSSGFWRSLRCSLSGNSSINIYWMKLRKIIYYGGSPILVSYAISSLSGYSALCVYGRSMQPTLNPDLDKNVEHYIDTTDNRMNIIIKRTLRRIERINFQDWVLVKSCRSNFEIKVGDIVTMYNPSTPSDRDIKRVRATENEVVTTRSYKNKVVIVPKGHIWVEGDNSSISKDSNIYGPIPAGLVFGKAVAVIWPLSRCRRLQSQFSNRSIKDIHTTECSD